RLTARQEPSNIQSVPATPSSLWRKGLTQPSEPFREPTLVWTRTDCRSDRLSVSPAIRYQPLALREPSPIRSVPVTPSSPGHDGLAQQWMRSKGPIRTRIRTDYRSSKSSVFLVYQALVRRGPLPIRSVPVIPSSPWHGGLGQRW